MNLTPEKIKRTRLVLRMVQMALIAVLVVAIWSHSQIDLWQKVLATLLAALLIFVQFREFVSKGANNPK